MTIADTAPETAPSADAGRPAETAGANRPFDALVDQTEAANAQVIHLMRSSSDAVQSGLSMFSAVRHLERIADHATNIAEDVVYLVAGEIVRHHPKALEITQ